MSIAAAFRSVFYSCISRITVTVSTISTYSFSQILHQGDNEIVQQSLNSFFLTMKETMESKSVYSLWIIRATADKNIHDEIEIM